MKSFVLILVLALLAGGCATSTIETRKQERYSAYASLAPESRELVDKGQIKPGMTMDAVYIAWGKPSQIITEQTGTDANITRWIYYGTTYREYRFWNYHYYPYGRYGYHGYPTLDYDYVPLSYVAGEVVFENGVVKRWRNATAPPSY